MAVVLATEAVRRHPERSAARRDRKAHQDVHELFYQVFDKGDGGR